MKKSRTVLLFLGLSLLCLLTLCGKMFGLALFYQLTVGGSTHDHKYGDWITVKQATCTEEGLQERYCYCLTKETEIIPATTHTPEEREDCAYPVYCSSCDKQLLPASEHSFGDWITVDPVTCTTNGTQERFCSVCDKRETKTIFSKGHKYDNWVIVREATCTEDGLRERYCVCGDKRSDVLTADHVGTWVTLKEPTKTENGVREIDCSSCNQKITETLYALGSQGLEYKVLLGGKTCSITGIGTCTDADVVIPMVIDGYTVVAIEREAFMGYAKMVTLTIPESITDIGEFIIMNTKNLTTLYYNTDYCCTSFALMNSSVKKIVIGASTIPPITSNVEEVVLSEKITSIPDGAFSGCYELKTIVIPESVTSIGASAFSDCRSLTEIHLPASITSIGERAFIASALTSFTVPEGVTAISDSMFGACHNLAEINIHSGVTSIGDSAFSGCTSLTSITIPASVTEIGDGAFSACNALSSITIPEGVKVISNSFCGYSETVKTITIPKSVTKICTNAFIHCSDLHTIVFRGTKDEWKAIEKETDWKLLSSLSTVICTDGSTSP